VTSTGPVIKEVSETRVISKSGKGPLEILIPQLIGEVMQQIFSPANQRGKVNINGPIMFLFENWMLTNLRGRLRI
jgi:hypothetical protein